MIYRHYGNGKLYYSVGFATRFSKDFPATSIEQVAIAKYTEATTPEENEDIAVLLVKDQLTGSTYYAYNSTAIDGVHVFYKDLDGKYWLRPIEMFFGTVESTGTPIPRFKKVRGEELFDIVAKI
jgi:hypothetical protein